MPAEPRSVGDYERLVETLKADFALDEAMSHAVGGDFEATGAIERRILEHFGLAPGMTLVDVGCGSGRLAHALSGMTIDYLGTDVVQDLIDYARTKSPPSFVFQRHTELTVPVGSGAADMICAFSLFTHLPHEESYIYMEDMHRALKPGGALVFSFLEFGMNSHWSVFADTVLRKKSGTLPHLNQFIEREPIRLWAANLAYGTPAFIDGDAAPWGGRALGQSVAVLRKP